MKIAYLAFWLAALAGFPAAGADAPAEDYRVCRNVHGERECLSFAEGCQGGLFRGDGKERSSCARLNARQCTAIESMFKTTFEHLKSQPASERKLESRLGPSCDAFTLRLPGHRASACIGVEKKGSAALHELMQAAAEACHE